MGCNSSLKKQVDTLYCSGPGQQKEHVLPRFCLNILNRIKQPLDLAHFCSESEWRASVVHLVKS